MSDYIQLALEECLNLGDDFSVNDVFALANDKSGVFSYIGYAETRIFVTHEMNKLRGEWEKVDDNYRLISYPTKVKSQNVSIVINLKG